jgi:Holliday junction resolvasome RuvABC endonuclease subunit
MKKTIRTLSHDPGSTNYGWAVTEVTYTGRSVQFGVLATGMLKHRIVQLKDSDALTATRRKYLREITRVVDKYRPTALIAERFMTRGMKGTLIEYVAFMLGLLQFVTHTYGMNYKLVPASQWKNEVTRWGVDLNDLYTWSKITPHQTDAVFMGLYMGCQVLDVPRPKVSRTLLNRVVKQSELTSKTVLVNRKRRR